MATPQSPTCRPIINLDSGSIAVHTSRGDEDGRSIASAFPSSPVSHCTQGGVKLIELDLVEMQIVQQIGRKSVQVLSRLPQPAQHLVGIDLEDPRRPSDAQAFGQTGDDAHDEVR